MWLRKLRSELRARLGLSLQCVALSPDCPPWGRGSLQLGRSCRGSWQREVCGRPRRGTPAVVLPFPSLCTRWVCTLLLKPRHRYEAQLLVRGHRAGGWQSWDANPGLRFLFEASPALGPGCEAEVLVAAGHLGGGGDIPHLGGAELSPPRRDALFPTQTTRAAGAILFLFPIFTSPLALFSNAG